MLLDVRAIDGCGADAIWLKAMATADRKAAMRTAGNRKAIQRGNFFRSIPALLGGRSFFSECFPLPFSGGWVEAAGNIPTSAGLVLFPGLYMFIFLSSYRSISF
jgi:hypothetical protein